MYFICDRGILQTAQGIALAREMWGNTEQCHMKALLISVKNRSDFCFSVSGLMKID